jgi:hypothetical protein
MNSQCSQGNVFEGVPGKKRTLPNDAHELRKMGLVRIQGIVPIALNEILKSTARANNMNADIYVGEVIQAASFNIREQEARGEVERLQQKFGNDFMDLFRQVAE